MAGRAVNEAAWQSRVIGAARAFGWRVFHPKPARLPNGRMVTAQDGHVGFPDLVLARNGVVILAELKQDGRYPGPEQRAWRDAIGDQWRCWRPKDWADVEATLR